jgi:hypothetical protein
MMNPGEWQKRCDRLLDLLMAFTGPGRVFNQYRDVQPDLDAPGGAMVRRRNLRCYLEAFSGAHYILVGEAAGYAGCRFSGIPFTCESQLIGPGRLSWTRPPDVARTLGPSSRAETLWAERSATMVWEMLGERRDCLLWNAFPWHPMGERGPLSNGQPGREVGQGAEALRCLLALLPAARPYAVGRVAQRALADLGREAPYIRHPSHGGKNKFAAALAGLPVRPANSYSITVKE